MQIISKNIYFNKRYPFLIKYLEIEKRNKDMNSLLILDY